MLSYEDLSRLKHLELLALLLFLHLKGWLVGSIEGSCAGTQPEMLFSLL